MRPITVQATTATAAIGNRLRAVRQERQMTMEQLAASAGLTKGFISRVERDKVSPSVATLVAICDVLDLPVGDLFVRTDAQFVKAEDAPHINLGGRNTSERLLSPRHESRVQVVRSHVEPGGSGGEELYTVNAELDFVHVVSGSLEVFFSDGSWSLGEGDSLTFDGREPHQWRSDEGAELIWVLAPAAWSGTV